MDVYICAAGAERDMIYSCLDGSVRMRAFLEPPFYYDGRMFQKKFPLQSDIIKNAADHAVFFCVDIQGKVYLRHEGVREENIISFFTKSVLKNPKSFQCLKITRWLHWYLYRRADIAAGNRQDRNYFREHEILYDIRCLKRLYPYRKIVIAGTGWQSGMYLKLLPKEMLWGAIELENDAGKPDLRDIEELLMEDTSNMWFYICDDKSLRAYEGRLIELGIEPWNIFAAGRRKYHSAGSKALNILDPIAGFVWKGNTQGGWIRFGGGCEGCEPDFRIVTLGGSTSDSTYENIKSWSELLYSQLKKMGLSVEIYSGGVACYTSAQECLKLIKDGLSLHPDLVISYSGTNDACDYLYDVKGHPFHRPYIAEHLKKLILKNKITGTGNVLVKGLTFGVKDHSSRAEFWIKTQKIMHAVCQEFGIGFHGFLQPYNDKLMPYLYENQGRTPNERFYEEAKRLIERQNQRWLHDISGLYEHSQDVYYDQCHVYEHGNRLVMKAVLPYVMDSIKCFRPEP